MTEAEDTVKTGIELCLTVCQEYRTLNLEGKDCIGLDCDVCQLNKQAEISFKAGQDSKASELLDGIPAAIAQARKNGIREVVEWIEHHTNRDRLELITKFLCISEIDWQAKLRDWRK